MTSSEIPAVLAELDALLSPSLSFENGPTIALEAMAVGTPIIASRVGNMAELIQDGVNGRLVEAGLIFLIAGHVSLKGLLGARAAFEDDAPAAAAP